MCTAPTTFFSLRYILFKLHFSIYYSFFVVGICKTIHLEGASIKKEKVDACFEADEKNRAFPICKLRNNLNQWLRTDVTIPTIPTETATVKTLIGAGNVSTQKS